MNLKALLKSQRTLLVAAFLFTLAIVCAVMISSHAQWLGSWRQTEHQALLSLTFIYSFTSAISARLASAPKRREYLTSLESAARPLAVIHGRLLGILIAVVALAFILPIAVAAFLTSRQGPYGAPYFAPVLFVAACSVTLAATFGYCFGRQFTGLPAAVFAGAVPYLAYALLQYSQSEALASLTISDARDQSFFLPPTELNIFKALCYLFAAFLLFSFLVDWYRARTFLAAGTALSIGLLTFTSSSSLQYDPESLTLSCKTRSSVSICMPAAYSHTENNISEILSATPLQEISSAGTRVRLIADYNLSDTARSFPTIENSEYSSIFAPSSERDQFAHVPSRNAVIESVGRGLFLGACYRGSNGSSTSSGDAPEAAQTLLTWFLRSANVPLDGSAFPGGPVIDKTSKSSALAQTFGEKSAGERVRWFKQNLDNISTCQLTVEDF